jgi:hypothetical protein
MARREAWFVTERAVRQAAQLWMQFPLLVAEKNHDSGPDLEIILDGESERPIHFGVEVKGDLELSAFLLGSRKLRPRVRSRFIAAALRQQLSMCIMVVQVRTLETYIGWLTVPSPEKRRMIPAPNVALRHATEEVLAETLQHLRDLSRAFDKRDSS